MCNLYSNTMPQDAMRDLFKVAAERDRLGNFEPMKAIFPRYDGVVCRTGEDGERELVTAHWGFLMPQVSKKTGKPILPKAINNARDDKIRSSRFWKKSFEDRRCLIPATAFCEAKGKKPATFYWFSVTDEQKPEPFVFAGLWNRFKGNYRDEYVEIDTYTMVTSTPNELVKPVHPDRMPVILPEDAQTTWMDGSPDEAFEALKVFPAEKMQVLDKGEDMKSEPS
ncbi:SOS response-associated peptidase [Histidinibacterium aquaticum]|uniref:Abasic site processing protein n=1 Tax=Histidinibacterium aquaticum TaxID=2613962 RepID=A0A5J5GMC1_9RHOB|nr:SOS response-associated peptidase [Histidinibacterium aquaticum]KAA9008768.1 SOS response-associated peptidase [Histidinibacterium aquaticum]